MSKNLSEKTEQLADKIYQEADQYINETIFKGAEEVYSQKENLIIADEMKAYAAGNFEKFNEKYEELDFTSDEINAMLNSENLVQAMIDAFQSYDEKPNILGDGLETMFHDAAKGLMELQAEQHKNQEEINLE